MYMVRKIAPEMLVHAVLQCSEEKCTVHTPLLRVYIVGQTPNLKPCLLCIIETKCVSEFDMLHVHGEENSFENICACSITV